MLDFWPWIDTQYTLLDSSKEGVRAGPLKGIRGLDFGMAAVGPLATTYLGLLGADLIKVEQPSGDIVRRPSGPTMQGMGGTVVRMNTALTSPHVEALGLVKELEHLVAGTYKTLDVLWRCSEELAELSPVPAPSGRRTYQCSLKNPWL